MPDTPLRILVIRRDNIGDLVCTTPLFSALRARFPRAEICALVNSYNVAVLENNPDIDAVYAYTKAKHRPQGQRLLRIYWERAALFLKLRRKRFDYAIVAGSLPCVPRALKLAHMVRPKRIIAYTEPGTHKSPGINSPVLYIHGEEAHEAEIVFGLLRSLGIDGPPPPVKVLPDPNIVRLARKKIAPTQGKRLIGVHISTRKSSQRWPAERFVELISKLGKSAEMRFVLFWSPGEETNPLHPGDDRKADEILSALTNLPITAYPTHRLQELIAGLSLCDTLICSDGGAMHLAAGLGKPILCFFGKSDSSRWHPWTVPYVLLQPPSQEVGDISVDDALEGYGELCRKAGLTKV